MTYNWDRALSRMLDVLYADETTDQDDRAVQAVLVALRHAVRGDIDLTDLACAVIDFARPGHYFTAEAEARRARREAERN